MTPFSRQTRIDVDEQLAEAEARLRELVAHEVEERTAELQRTLARARADSISLLADEERRLAEERRREVAELEQRASAELTQKLVGVQERVEQRIAAWAQDLERAQAA